MQIAEIEALAVAFDDPSDGAAMKSRELILAMLADTPEPFSRRQFSPGHITCTGLVMGPTGRVLLVDHARLKRWLLPGGHVEADDASAAEATRREVLEETSAELDPAATPVLAGMDVHAIPPKKCEPFHQHHDLICAFAAVSERAVRSEESRAVAWCSETEFDQYGVPSNVRLAYARMRKRL